jgi:hypothetical protein
MRASAASSTDVLSADNVPCEQQKSFFGDFLPISKKLPAPWSGSSCSQENGKTKALDSRFRGNDERETKAGNDERETKSCMPASLEQ